MSRDTVYVLIVYLSLLSYCVFKEYVQLFVYFFFSSRRRHTRYWRDWSSDVCSSDLPTMDELDAIASRGGTARGVPTGIRDLDELTNGLQAGQMVVIAARPGVGKALEIGRASCRERV